MRILVVIPTYNERENIGPITRAVCEATASLSQQKVEVLVVDDNSPDGTAAVVAERMREESRLHLLNRPGKQGLGRAYIAGFQWALAKNFDAVVEMDADFSHRPEDLLKILQALSQSDFVVGSRYVPGGETVNWGFMRKFISRGGSLYARLILGFPLKDWTGGFNAWKRQVLEKIDYQRIKSEGYSFQIELKYRSLRAGLRGQEVPIVFEDRRVGKSKMSLRIVIEGFLRVWGMRFA